MESTDTAAPGPAGPAPGRREQNRQRTHRSLVEAAGQLFQEKGFEAVTVRDIAAAAGVGERTFFRYFPSKESLVLQQVRDLIPSLEAAIRARPASEPPLTALRNAVLELARREGANPAILLAGPLPPRIDPTSRGDRFLLFDLEEAVASAFLARLGPPGDGIAPLPGCDARAAGAPAPDVPAADRATALRVAVLSRTGVAVMRSVRLAYAQLPEAERADTDVTQLVHAAFAALQD
ncbi:TetR family transcriptional regulator [Streptacidiphilus sp. PB12-B1b]|uniref:TetR family transcriptional regulator n=1 Tax=Streptacidiphilus sp. PB12-B1b TaxID=2705012 RepID=UPI0015FA223D|nr:TetR family transcriptional regulator [Streptacidiphilus sp. PB12-B1b]QMU76633.1 TetR family transcriptional regulator [Streptacidiphilus sp. PB12-B1b]